MGISGDFMVISGDLLVTYGDLLVGLCDLSVFKCQFEAARHVTVSRLIPAWSFYLAQLTTSLLETSHSMLNSFREKLVRLVAGSRAVKSLSRPADIRILWNCGSWWHFEWCLWCDLGLSMYIYIYVFMYVLYIIYVYIVYSIDLAYIRIYIYIYVMF